MASHDHIDDADDDFGSDFTGTNRNRNSGNKRGFGDLEKTNSKGTHPGTETGTILHLRERQGKEREAALIVLLAKQEKEIAELKAAVRGLKLQLKPPSDRVWFDKCKTLQEENEELGIRASEGKHYINIWKGEQIVMDSEPKNPVVEEKVDSPPTDKQPEHEVVISENS